MNQNWKLTMFVMLALVAFSIGCASTQGTPAPTPTPTVAPTAVTASSTTSAPTGGIFTVKLVVVPEKSKANYRVTEQLVGQNLPDDAVGSTNAISGAIVGKTDGTIDTSQSKFVVDLRTLRSDQSLRDGFIQRTPLQTSQYPYATFVPTSGSGFPNAVPASGQGSFKLTGNMTIRGVTKPLTWDVSCQLTNGQVEGICHATTSFTFEDFNLDQPRVGRVLSIVDKITLEVDVDLMRVNP